MAKNTFGKRMKLLRIEIGITLDEMATRLQTTKSTLSRYENGLRNPKGEFVSRVADFFCVSVDYLMGKSENKYSHLEKIASSLKEDEYIKLSNYARDKKISPEKLKKILELIEGDN